MTSHRPLTDADLAGSRPVSEAELQAAIANVIALTDDDFIAACEFIGHKVQM